MRGICRICENVCDYDKETIKSDTYKLNGIKVIICGNCADDFVKIIKKRMGVGRKSKYYKCHDCKDWVREDDTVWVQEESYHVGCCPEEEGGEDNAEEDYR